MKNCLPYALSILFSFSAIAAFANVSLPALFSDNMVLQQNTEITIWGWAKPLEKIWLTTTWRQDTLEWVVGNQARWEIKLNTPKADGIPHEIQFEGHNLLIIKNILLGEVWLCSGQSNMEWSANNGFDNAEEAVRNADHPGIRLFAVPHRTASAPQDDLRGKWETCTPETMRSFSAVAYFFAKKIQEEMGVPVGLINASWGGSPAEAWVPATVIAADPALAAATKLLRNEPWSPNRPGSIYHAMIAPLAGFKMAGALWYQGETNTANPLTYKELLSTLIGAWRREWGYDFPFYFAQIAPWNNYPPEAGALVRDAQRRALEVPGTAMVVTSDIGDTTDIHPRNKQDVGLRFANLALKNRYQKISGEVSSPLYRRFEVENDRVRLFFDHAEGLHFRGEKALCFELAGPDLVFRPAAAFVESGTVVVSSAEVPRPVAVRFAWANTATPNLFNGAGLPASCFQAD